ncbi:MAG: DUF1385 domain-containing protein [Clostridia bacterium]|nr:DUF1385 domain-containing protein [Clostridia bacterium]
MGNIKTSIGGQALIEGIMMRGPKKTALAVRNPQGEMVIECSDTPAGNSKVAKIPFVRGIVNLVSSLKLGYKYLMRSAEISGLEEAEAELAKEKEEKRRAKAEKKGKEYKEKEKSDKKSGLSAGVMLISSLLGVAIAVVLFIFLPTWVSTLILGPNASKDYPVWVAVISGVIKVLVLIGYMASVSLMKDIKRTFMYHGAEHKTIFCYEHGNELTVENVKKERRFHPRCGTSFIFLMVFVGVIVMIPIGLLLRLLPAEILENRLLYTLIRTGVALLLVPFMAGGGYELIRLAGRHDNVITKIISAPGLWLQRITTKEPDDSMIECAIAAVKEVIPDDGSDHL